MVFLLLGWAPVTKGVDLFVRAAEESVQQGNKKASFIIVGRGETREFVASMPESARLGRFLRIIDPVEDFPSLLNGVDVLVSSSRREAFSYAVVEAMAAGKLILCSERLEILETCGQSDGVWLFPSLNWTALAELIARASSISPTQRESFGRANSEYAREHCSLEVWARQIGGIYTAALKESCHRL